jgi:hypothetical protein
MLKAAAKTTASNQQLRTEPRCSTVGKSWSLKKESRLWSCSVYVEVSCAETQCSLLRLRLISVSVSELKQIVWYYTQSSLLTIGQYYELVCSMRRSEAFPSSHLPTKFPCTIAATSLISHRRVTTAYP